MALRILIQFIITPKTRRNFNTFDELRSPIFYRILTSDGAVLHQKLFKRDTLHKAFCPDI